MNKLKDQVQDEPIHSFEEKGKTSFGTGLSNVLKKAWHMKESGIIVPTIIFAIFVQIVNPIFLSGQNISNVLRQAGFVLIPAIGMTLVLIVGGIDLSVGSVLGLGSFAVGFCMVSLNLPIWLSIIAAIIVGIIIGWINGKIIVKFVIPPIIMTLGMMYMARGLIFVSTKGLPIYPLPKSFQAIEQKAVFVLPTIVIISLVLCIIFQIILTRTTFGRSVYAIGGNPDAAKLSGINIDKIKTKVYAISGMMAAIAGIIMASRLELVVIDTKSDQLFATSEYQNAFATNPNINVCINVCGFGATAAAKAMKEAGLEGKVIIMGIDDIQETLDGIKEGSIFATMTQNFYRMGYEPVKWISEFVKEGKKPANVVNDSGTLVVTKANIENYKADMRDPTKW